MALSKLATGMQNALIQTTETASSRGWNTWKPETLPGWITLGNGGEAITTGSGRWKVEVLTGSVLVYADSVNKGSKTPGTYTFAGALNIYQMSSGTHTEAILTRLF